MTFPCRIRALAESTRRTCTARPTKLNACILVAEKRDKLEPHITRPLTYLPDAAPTLPQSSPTAVQHHYNHAHMPLRTCMPILSHLLSRSHPCLLLSRSQGVCNAFASCAPIGPCSQGEPRAPANPVPVFLPAVHLLRLPEAKRCTLAGVTFLFTFSKQWTDGQKGCPPIQL